MALIETIDQHIKQAMLAKDADRLRGLRGIKAALLLARTEGPAGAGIPAETEIKLLQKLAKQRKESVEIYQQQNREDLAKIELDELQVIEEFLPAQMSEAELEAALKKILEETGATSVKDMGKVMQKASRELAGKADGKMIAEMTRKLLS